MEFNFFFPLTLRDAHVQKGPLTENVYILSEAVTLSGPPVENTDLEILQNGNQALVEGAGIRTHSCHFSESVFILGQKKRGGIAIGTNSKKIKFCHKDIRETLTLKFGRLEAENVPV